MFIPLRIAAFPKAVLAVCIGLIILALVLDSPPHQGRRNAIAAALKAGDIGRLTAARSAYLKMVLVAIAHEAGIHDQIILNSTDLPQALHIYTTSPAAESLTGCGRGNAVYDAEGDTVFIDESLVNPTDFLNLGQETQHSTSVTLDDIPPLKTYLLFLLFHELGHRALHRHASLSFDTWKSKERRRELEADQFAISLLEKSLINRSPLTESIFAKGYSYGLPVTSSTSARDRVWLALVEMAHFISVSTMFSATPLSAIYEDAAHPSFLDRAESIIDSALLDKTVSPKLQEYFGLSREAIARVRLITKHRVAELVFAEPIYDVAFDSEGMFVMPQDPAHLYHVLKKDLDKGKEPLHTVFVSLNSALRGNGFPDLGPASTSQYNWSAIWSTPSSGTYSIRPGQAFVSTGDFWRLTSNGIGKLPLKYSIQHIVTPPEPAAVAVIEASTAMGVPLLISLCDGKICAERETRAIANDAKLDAKYFFVNTVTDDNIYLEAHNATNTDALGSLRGVIKLDSRTLTVKEAIPLSSQMCSVATEADAIWDPLSFVIVPEVPHERFICFATRHEFEDQWYAWELKPGNNFGTEVVSAPFLIGGLRKKRSELDDFESTNYSPSGLNAWWVGGSRIILQLFNDSAWVVDLEPRKATILFHPGGEMTRIAVGRNSLAIFYRGGYKCYVVSSS